MDLHHALGRLDLVPVLLLNPAVPPSSSLPGVLEATLAQARHQVLLQAHLQVQAAKDPRDLFPRWQVGRLK